MRPTTFPDYGLRALMRIADDFGRANSSAEIADAVDISRHHLTVAVAVLANAGHITTRRGHHGGAALPRPTTQIRLGDVVRVLESDTAPVKCFRPDGGTCRIMPRCLRKDCVREGEAAFLAALDRWTLADCTLSGGGGGPVLAGGAI